MASKEYENSDLEPAVLAAREEMEKNGYEVMMVDNIHVIDFVYNFAADSALRACGITTAPLLESTEKAGALEAQEELDGVVGAAVEKLQQDQQAAALALAARSVPRGYGRPYGPDRRRVTRGGARGYGRSKFYNRFMDRYTTNFRPAGEQARFLPVPEIRPETTPQPQQQQTAEGADDKTSHGAPAAARDVRKIASDIGSELGEAFPVHVFSISQRCVNGWSGLYQVLSKCRKW